MLAVLEHMRVAFDPRAHSYFVWMFATGMRPEEAIEMRWSDIDFHGQTAHVCRARCASEVKETKTFEVRDVDLGPEAIEALRAMAAYTQRSGEPDAEIFQNPNTGRPWNDSRGQHENFWVPALAACRISKRRSYNTRHTYATLRLMLGAVPAYISNQLGHESPAMVFKTYSRWISQDTTERDRVRALLAAQAATPA
jgi:integrase